MNMRDRKWRTGAAIILLLSSAVLGWLCWLLDKPLVTSEKIAATPKQARAILEELNSDSKPPMVVLITLWLSAVLSFSIGIGFVVTTIRDCKKQDESKGTGESTGDTAFS